jgi:hypothetical protein
MTDNQTTGGAPSKKKKDRLGFLTELAIRFLIFKSGEQTRDKRKSKGKKPPTTGICGPLNHDEDGNPWLWLEIETVRGYPLMEPPDKRDAIGNLEDAIKSFSGWFGDFQDAQLDLQVQGWPYDLDEIEKRSEASVIGTLPTRLEANHKKSRRKAQAEIRRLNFRERRGFVGVKLRNERSFLFRIVAQLILMMGFGSLHAHGNEEEIYKDQIAKVVGKFMDNNVPVRLLSGKETARVIQHCIYRGHTKMPITTASSGVINTRPALRRLANCVARDHFDMVEIFQDGESSYVAYMAVAELPRKYSVNWMFYGDMDRRPVEVSARLNVEPLKLSVGRNARSLNIVDRALEHLHEKRRKTTSVDPEIGRFEARQDVLLQEKERLEEDEPKVKAYVFMVVAGSNPAAVRQNCEYVMARCKKGKVVLEVDEANLAEIRRQTYPGSRLLYKDYRLDLFADGVAIGMPHATPVIGNGGDMMGVVRGPEEGPFLYAHRMVLKKGVDSPPGAIAAGPSGEGKSSLFVNLGLADAAAGMAVIYDEGKGDSRVLKGARFIVPHRILDLSSPEFHGLLNTMYLGETVKESIELTHEALMMYIGKEAEQGWRTTLKAVITDELEEYPKDPDYWRILNERLLGADPSDDRYRIKREIGEALRGLMNAENAELIFSKGKPWWQVAQEYIIPGQMLFVVYGHLTPPDDKETPDDALTERQRLAVIVRKLTNVIYHRFAMNPDVLVAIYKDEIQIDNRMGGNISSSYLSRIGRSKGATVTVGGQLIGDSPRDVWANTSTIYLFTFKETSEAEEAMNRLGIHSKEGTAEWYFWMNLLLGKRGSGRKKYDVIIKTYTGEIALVALNQLYHEGQFVSNIEGVAERRQLESGDGVADQFRFIRRVDSPEAAQEALEYLGVSTEMFKTPNGHSVTIEAWKEVAMELNRDERLVMDDDGELKVLRDVQVSVQQLPMS